MTFSLKATINVGGEDIDISSSVRSEERIRIKRGRQNEMGVVPASTATLSLKNDTGNFAPNNPLGTYYGQIGQYTPITIEENTLGTALLVQDTFTRTVVSAWGVTEPSGQQWYSSGGSASERTVAGGKGTIAFTTSFSSPRQMLIPYFENSEIKVKITSANVAAAGNQYFPGAVFRRSASSGDYFSVELVMQPAGVLRTNATRNGVLIGSQVDTGLTYSAGESFWLRAQMIGHVFRWKIWKVAAGVEPTDWEYERNVIDDDTIAVTEEAERAAPAWGYSGVHVYAGGTPVTVSIDFDDLTITDPTAGIRFAGEIASWKPRRTDVSGNVKKTEIEAAGIRRRLSQRQRPVFSPLKRFLLGRSVGSDLIAYWPTEDGENSTQVASAVDGMPAMRVSGAPVFATNQEFECSAALPTMGTGKFQVLMPSHVNNNEITLLFLCKIPSGGATNLQNIFRMTTSSGYQWRLAYETASSGSMRLRVLDPDGTEIHNAVQLWVGNNGKTICLELSITQSGSDAVSRFDRHTIATDGSLSSTLGTSATVTGVTVGRMSQLIVANDKGLTDVVLGHFAYSNLASQSSTTFGKWIGLTDESRSPLSAFFGEPAGRRIFRICKENGIPFVARGDLEDTRLMGKQRIIDVLSLLDDASESDGGILHETRWQVGLSYLPRNAMHNPELPTLTLVRTAGELAESLDEDTDDAFIWNDVTVNRNNGSSARAVQTSGPLNVNDPTDDSQGVGIIDGEVTIYTSEDSDLLNQANWRKHLGTWGAARYPQISVELGRDPELTDHSPLTLTGQINSALAVETGSLLRIDQPSPAPVDMPAGDIDTIVQGYEETIDQFTWNIKYNNTPAGAWYAFTLEDDELGRLASGGSELAADITSSATSLLVSTTESGGALWIVGSTGTDPANFPIPLYVGGEKVSVTEVAGITSPQTFTVVRNQNGVSRAWPAGTEVNVTRAGVLI